MQNFIVHQMLDILKIVRGQIDSFELIITLKMLDLDLEIEKKYYFNLMIFISHV